MERDDEHLKLLSLFFYIRGGLSAFFSCFFLIYVAMGVMIATVPAFAHGRNNGPPPELGFILAIVGTVIVALGWIWSTLVIYTGRCIAQRRHRLFCMIVAGISCVFVPYGTLLGIFTLMVLQRPSVHQLFDQPYVPK